MVLVFMASPGSLLLLGENPPEQAVERFHQLARQALGGIRQKRDVELTLGYYHVLENSVSGPMYGPMPLPNSDVTSTMSENSFMIGFSFIAN